MLKESRQDTGYAWVVLVASFINNAIMASVVILKHVIIKLFTYFKVSAMLKESRQDTGYAWVVLVASFINNAIMASVVISLSVYMIDWIFSFYISSTSYSCLRFPPC